jgi:hypothetical protein
MMVFVGEINVKNVEKNFGIQIIKDCERELK